MRDDTLRILNQGSKEVRDEINNQDHIFGGDGNDTIIHIQDTNARINGGSGTDIITIAPELNRAKVVFGGNGNDLFILKPNNNQDPAQYCSVKKNIIVGEDRAKGKNFNETLFLNSKF